MLGTLRHKEDEVAGSWENSVKGNFIFMRVRKIAKSDY
jgi:hypothetical protein